MSLAVTLPAYRRLRAFSDYLNHAAINMETGQLTIHSPPDAHACLGAHYARHCDRPGPNEDVSENVVFCCKTGAVLDCPYCGYWGLGSDPAEMCLCTPETTYYYQVGRELMLDDLRLSEANFAHLLIACMDAPRLSIFRPFYAEAWPQPPEEIWPRLVRTLAPIHPE